MNKSSIAEVTLARFMAFCDGVVFDEEISETVSRTDPAIMRQVATSASDEAIARIARSSLMDRTDPKTVAKFSDIIMKNPRILEIHDVHLIRPSSRERYFSAHIVLDACLSLAEVEEIIEELRHDLSHAGATHVLLQPETSKYAGKNNIHCNGHSEHHHH
jgi:Co/Zn/Cd efflux system component